MSSRTAHLLKAFEALPEEEKRLFTVEFPRRAVPFDSGPLDDAETADATDQLIASLEADQQSSLGQFWYYFHQFQQDLIPQTFHTHFP